MAGLNMMSHRIERVNHLFRREISELLKNHVKDPRLGTMITVTEVVTSRDLKYARVFVSGICNGEEQKEVLKGLSSAAGFIRKELMDSLEMRHIPEFNFQWDDSIERGEHLVQLMERVERERAKENPGGGLT